VSLRKTCGNCGRGVEPGTAFCTGCGSALGEVPALRLEDRRRVSVLFIDVVEFTGYAETIDPEQVRVMQNNYFGTVRRVIRQYGGVVEKYIGDAVMALFGAPVATENDALRCVRAGLELQRVLGHSGADGTALHFRVGIATGEALVDIAAAHDGGQAIVAGDVVNTAARLQAVAPAGGVYVCATTQAATSHDIEYEEQAPVVLRGRSQSSRVWLAIAARASRPEGGNAESTPMVDREHERALLINALHRTVRNRVPQLITVFGEAGIGKSRLLRELARHASRLVDPPVTWLVGHCPPFGEDVTFAALADIVKACAGILDSDDETTARNRLEEALAELADAHEALRLADALGPLLGLPGSRLASAETEGAWRRFVLLMAARHPTVLAFEDLHWADEGMLRFIEMLGASARDLPLLILCTARPVLRDQYPRWTNTISGTVSISLTPLRDSDISTMYSLMFGQAFAAKAPYPLVELADGNPLYAQEYVRMLVEGGVLRAVGPQWTSDGHEAPPMPDNVQAVIANRLDLLDPADRAVLQAAAVVGREFWPGAVAAAVGRPVEAVEWALRRLAQRDLIQEMASSKMADQLEYRFRHVLVRDVCYQRLPRAERVARHQRTADWLEAVSGGRQTDLAEVLANHRWAAHEIARTLGADPAPYAHPARVAMQKAARRAYALHAMDTAAQWVARARGLKLDDDPALDLFAAELEFYRDSDVFLAGGGAERLAMLAGTLFSAGRRAEAAHGYTLLGTVAWTCADRAGTLRYLDQAVELYADLPDTEEKAEALHELARVHMLNFEHEPAIAAANAAAEMAERLGLVEVRANSRITLATGRYAIGDPSGFAALADITEHCRRHGLSSRRRAVQNLAWATLEEGDIAGSDRLLDEHRGIDLAGNHGLSTNFARECQQAYFNGDWGTAIDAAAVSMSQPSTEWDHHVPQSVWLRLLRGERLASDTGPDAIDQAVDAARRSGFHRVLRSTLAHAALCRALQDRAGAATALLAELDEDWSTTRMLAWGEWVAAAANAGAALGGDQATRVRAMLERSARHTPWIRAAVATLSGVLAGDPEQHLHAAQLYAEMGNATDRVLAQAAAVRALIASGQPERAVPIAAEVTAFAERNQAVRLLDGLG
jgi:class 3 adenylate cyclase